MQYAIRRERIVADRLPGDTVSVLALFDDVRGCEKFAQRVLVIGAGSSRERLAGDDDEVLYVLAGSGSFAIGGERIEAGTGAGLFVARGVAWSVSCDGPLELLSVLVRAPLATDATHALVDLAAEDRRAATAAREFTLGVRPEVGCASVTQFIGFVPPGRAPDHYHRYDEVLYILEGAGVLHIAGQEAPLAPGVCVHLPAKLVHSLENSGSTVMELLGVFTPAGSPAEAYYPDGSAAVYPQES